MSVCPKNLQKTPLVASEGLKQSFQGHLRKDKGIFWRSKTFILGFQKPQIEKSTRTGPMGRIKMRITRKAKPTIYKQTNHANPNRWRWVKTKTPKTQRFGQVLLPSRFASLLRLYLLGWLKVNPKNWQREGLRAQSSSQSVSFRYPKDKPRWMAMGLTPQKKSKHVGNVFLVVTKPMFLLDLLKKLREKT